MSNMKFPESSEINIVIFPDFDELKTEVENLREEMSELITEYNELIFHGKKQLEAEYLVAFGGLEFKLYELDCEHKRLKRKAEMIQARINRQEQVNMQQIDRVLDDEFYEYQQKMENLIDRINEAVDYKNQDSLTPEETTAFKKMYHNIVKQLHPDLHPDLSPVKLDLYQRAVEAYERGDVQTMNLIFEMIQEPVISAEDSEAMPKLAAEKKRLLRLIEKLKTDTEKVLNRFPFTERELLQDKEARMRKREELNKAIEQLQKLVQAYKTKIEEMLR